MSHPLRIAVLVSGTSRGSNLRAIVAACENGQINGSVTLVVGSRSDSPALQFAAEKSVDTLALAVKDFSSEEEYDNALLDALDNNNTDLICLAGYMRLLSTSIVQKYKHRVMNIHPALIPMFYGQGMYGHHVHEAAIKRGVKISGVTVHFVDEEYDTGPIIVQIPVEVTSDDTPETLAAKVLEKEHEAYPLAVSLFSHGRLQVQPDKRVKVLQD